MRMRVKLTKSSCRFLLAWGFTSIWDARRMADLVMCWTLSMVGVRFWRVALRATRKAGGSDRRARWFQGSGLPVDAGSYCSSASALCSGFRRLRRKWEENQEGKAVTDISMNSTWPLSCASWSASTFHYQDTQFRDKWGASWGLMTRRTRITVTAANWARVPSRLSCERLTEKCDLNRVNGIKRLKG